VTRFRQAAKEKMSFVKKKVKKCRHKRSPFGVDASKKAGFRLFASESVLIVCAVICIHLQPGKNIL
jgi:hypothetical protein